ncbi:hypothetical protein H9660_08245 [Clostridium sp. Sa3CUN1]|uniref:Lipoprotein n=1 Tax=Clostridium gallinarum TaxID=2762246 RepID=A0ABR8Q3Z0_9CLOT|nr:hypothetical protein [Clostridium gallinarum]MBD7915139.1 hypothetical protein [Clostridium gallinarum]
MNIIKRIVFVMVIFIFTLSIGCSKVNGKDTQSIKAPDNENLSIRGTWKIDDINILDDKIENKEETLSLKNTIISISNTKISIFNNIYSNPSFKLKVVKDEYVLSYELNLKISDIVESKETVDVISLIDSNKLIGEFIVLDENSGYLFYSGILLKLSKEDINPTEVDMANSKFEAEVLVEDYNSDVGVMLALKTPRTKNEDGTYTNETYRTLWISFKDNEIQTVIQKDNIIFPRLNGIWTIEKLVEEKNDKHIEYFLSRPIDGKLDSYIVEDSNVSIYKNINFISNDYISIEKYEGNEFSNEFSIYQTIPIDNINSKHGLSIEEIYSNEVNEKYERDFNEAFENLTKENAEKSINIVDFTNFTLRRVEGKWTLIGSILKNDGNEENIDYKISISPSKKILNYDRLLIPWKNLKGRFPFIDDAYTSPTGRIALIIFDNKLLIYEMEDRNIKGSPLCYINLNQDEKVIMSEWSSGSYVDTWSKAFKDGIEINMEED